MLPTYISKDGERDQAYNRNTDLYFADHYKIFNTDETRFAINKEDYICFDLLRYAIDALVDGAWLYTPTIDFGNSDLNQKWSKLREDSKFDDQLKEATRKMLYLGDAPIKTVVDENISTASDDDYKICIYSFAPHNWYPDYYKFNTERQAKTDTVLIKKELDNGDEAYLLEKFSAGKIVYTAYIERIDEEGDLNKSYTIQVNPRTYFEEELYGVLHDENTSETELEITYTTNTEYSLLQVFQNHKRPDDYFGESLFNWAVVSKINAINKYANLEDHVVVNNSIPKLELSGEAAKLLDQAIQEVVGGTYGNNVTTTNSPQPETFNRPVDKTFMTRSSYLRSSIIANVIKQMEVYVNDGRSSTRYITNDFDLTQLRNAQDKLIDSLMSELGISAVLYKDDVSTGTLSGIAYERLMSLTLNKVKNIQNRITETVKIIAFTIMQLDNTISDNPVELDGLPSVTFHQAVTKDQKEELENWVIRTQNKFTPLIEAIKDINNIDEETAQEWLSKMESVSQTAALTEDVAVNQNMQNIRNNLKLRINGGQTTESRS